MTVSYSTLLRLNVITTGTEDGQWGDITNTNIGTLIEQAIAGSVSVDVSSGNVTLTTANGASDQSRCMALRVSGTPGTTRSIIAPAASKMYIVANGSDSSVVIKTSTSTGLTVPSGEIYLVYFDTTLLDFVYVGASATSANTANKIVLRDASGNFAAGAITATSFTGTLANGVTATTQTPGDNSTKVATTAFVAEAANPIIPYLVPSGGIIMWSGSIASIPSGWYLCDGSNGTPDLRDRFVVGAGTTYPVAGTGGSKDAVVVSHTHTASVTDPGHFHTYSGQVCNDGSSSAGYGLPVMDSQPAATVNFTFAPTKTTGISVSNSTTGSSGTNANLPPYFALAFIMKS